MSGYPYGNYPPQPPPGGWPPPYSPPYPPTSSAHSYPPPPNYPHGYPHGQYPPPPPQPYYVPGMMMIPVPVATVPVAGPAQPPADNNTTYVTNYIYHGEKKDTQTTGDEVQVTNSPGDFKWVPTTSLIAVSVLSERAFAGGHEGWDGSPLWVIRSWHNGDLVPGKLSVRHNSGSIPYNGKEVSVQNIEVLCAKPESLRWIPASNGHLPPGAIEGGRKTNGETLYVGRARYQLSVTPGKVQKSRNACLITFAGTEVVNKMYDVLCRIS